MASFNQIIIMGNVGSDPEMRYTPNGNPVTSFSIAVNRVYTTADGEKKEEVEWFRVDTWNRTAEIANQFLTKGSPVQVVGRVKLEQWTSQDGRVGASMRVNCRDLILMGGSQGGSNRPPPPEGTTTEAPEGGAPSDAEDLPW